MKLFQQIDEITPEYRNSYVTIGNFDGIHLGHQALFEKLVTEARENNCKAIVITFDPHPQKVLHPEKRPFFLLTPLEEKLQLINSKDIDAVLLFRFSLDFAKITAEDFVEQILWGGLHVTKLLIGYDYAFGNRKKGNGEFLKEYGRKLGFQTEEIGPVTIGSITVSSTKIRLAILDGDVKLAAALLGRPYNICGTVVKGYQRGTDIGIATANIATEKVIPAIGVYAIIAILNGKRYQGVLNIGYNPTFGNDKISTEVHLLDFHENIYGRKMEILFIDRLRNEMKFESPQKLVAQIKSDIENARLILQPYGA